MRYAWVGLALVAWGCPNTPVEFKESCTVLDKHYSASVSNNGITTSGRYVVGFGSPEKFHLELSCGAESKMIQVYEETFLTLHVGDLYEHTWVEYYEEADAARIMGERK